MTSLDAKIRWWYQTIGKDAQDLTVAQWLEIYTESELQSNAADGGPAGDSGSRSTYFKALCGHIVWVGEIMKFQHRVWSAKHMAIKVYCGPWCCISWALEICTENDKDCISEKRRARGLTSDSVRVQRMRCLSSGRAAFLVWGLSQRFWARRGGGERRRGNWSGRVWDGEVRGVTEECSRDRDQVIFNHRVDSEEGGRDERPSERAWRSIIPKLLKETLGHWADLFSKKGLREDEHKQMNYLIPVCNTRVWWKIPTENDVYVIAALKS